MVDSKNINFDFSLLKNAVVEKDVENAYRLLFSRLFTKYSLTSPYGSDGLLEGNQLIEEDANLKVLCEFKYEVDLSSKLEQSKILIQSVFYLKKFENGGKILPNVIFIGDKNECFACHTNSLTKYLNYNVDWNTAPSNAYKLYPEMLSDIVDDNTINPFIFKLNDNFQWKAISRKLRDLSNNVTRLIKVKDSNIVEVFNYFCENVLTKKCNLSDHDKASLFIIKLIKDDSVYLHPRKKGVLVTKDFGEVKVNEENYINFFEHYDGSQYSIREKEELVKITDRIIDDTNRRRSGDFFTPAIWVDEAHKMISEQFGEDWKEKYVVWDCAWGTGNLTRDYKFNELYCSTLSQGEIDVANNNRVNPEATKFQYDFLNDGIIDGKIDVLNDPKLPQGLKDAILNGKEIIFLINPPYKRVSNISFNLGDDIEGKDIKNNNVYTLMKNNDMGNSVEQLYTQFLFKMTKISDIHKNLSICIYCPSIYLTGEAYKKFRILFLDNFKFMNGFLFNANHFDSVSDGWGISFSIYKHGKNEDTQFNYYLKDIDDFKIYNIDNKILYNLDNTKSLSVWLRENNIKIKSCDFPNLSSALNVIDKKKSRCGKMIPNSLGFFFNGGNNTETNWSHCSFLSSAYSGGLGISVTNENFNKSIITFSARNLIKSNWINGKDEYLAPTEEIQETEQYKQFQYDSIVYSLFNTSSNQSSMRQVDYKDKKWDIKNEFFWLSKERMLELSETNNFEEMYYDAKFAEERHVYKLLFGEERIYDKLSVDARNVLDLATRLVEKTYKFRQTLHQSKPEYHLQAWDAGWYQIKLILKEYYPIDYARFVGTYRAFEDRMRPMVYELGFLK